MSKTKNIFLDKKQLSLLKEASKQEGVSIFDKYCQSYTPEKVLADWVRGIPQQWAPLINAHTYQKALEEFTKYGEFIRFPEELPYKMLTTIMRNAAILKANAIWRFEKYKKNFLLRMAQKYLLPLANQNGDNFVLYKRRVGNYLIVSFGDCVDFDFFINNFKNEIKNDPYALEELTDFWETSGLNIPFGKFMYGLTPRFVEQTPKLRDLIFNIVKNNTYTFHIDFVDGRMVNRRSKETQSIFNFLRTRGFFEALKRGAPQESGLYFSVSGIDDLKKVLDQYNPSMTPEEVLVLVNRALDVTHDRGSLAEAFIQGGTEALDAISHSNKSGKFPQYGEQPNFISYDFSFKKDDKKNAK